MNVGLNNAVDPQARGGKLLPVRAAYVALPNARAGANRAVPIAVYPLVYPLNSAAQNEKGLAFANPLNSLVGARGFEPPTPCTPCTYATRLRYAPTSQQLYLRQKIFLRFL